MASIVYRNNSRTTKATEKPYGVVEGGGEFTLLLPVVKKVLGNKCFLWLLVCYIYPLMCPNEVLGYRLDWWGVKGKT